MLPEPFIFFPPPDNPGWLLLLAPRFATVPHPTRQCLGDSSPKPRAQMPSSGYSAYACVYMCAGGIENMASLDAHEDEQLTPVYIHCRWVVTT